MSLEPRIVSTGEGPSYHVLGGDHITIKAGAAETQGAMTILETTTPPGGGPPPHCHSREDEIFYVIEGEFEFHIGTSKHHVGPGGLVIAPRNVPHRFQNQSTGTGKLLIVCQPAGFEEFVREFATLPTDAPPQPQQLAELGAKYGIEFVQE